MISHARSAGSRLAESRIPLRGPNSLWHLAYGDYRVSPFRTQASQDELGLGGRGRGALGGGACGLPPGRDVVPVVPAGHRAVAPAPAPAVLGVALPLAGRLPAGPLPGTHAGIRSEEGLAERTPLASLPRGPGHRHTSAPRVSPLPGPIERGERPGRENQKETDYELRRTGTRGRDLTGHGYRCSGEIGPLWG